MIRRRSTQACILFKHCLSLGVSFSKVAGAALHFISSGLQSRPAGATGSAFLASLVGGGFPTVRRKTALPHGFQKKRRGPLYVNAHLRSALPATAID